MIVMVVGNGVSKWNWCRHDRSNCGVGAGKGKGGTSTVEDGGRERDDLIS